MKGDAVVFPVSRAPAGVGGVADQGPVPRTLRSLMGEAGSLSAGRAGLFPSLSAVLLAPQNEPCELLSASSTVPWLPLCGRSLETLGGHINILA